MPFINTVHDSLPYIDAEPTASERASAVALIAAEVTSDTSNHPSLPSLRPQHFSPLMEAEMLRIERKEPLKAIDLPRYEALEPPTTSPYSDEKHPETLQKWRDALSKAYTSHTYLTGRQNNLALLEKFGKNAWLIGNSQLEDILRGLERELAERKTDIDIVVVERKTAQEAVGPEIMGLDEGWKRGVGRVLEVEVAAEEVRKQVLDRRRQGAR